MRVKDKVAIVVGAGLGIGKATSLLLASEGAKVTVADLIEENAQKTVSEIKADGGEAIAMKVDMTKESETILMTKATLDKFGKIDILCNVAGGSFGPHIREKPVLFANSIKEEWDRIIDINLNGARNCTRAVVNHMIERRYGKIINIASFVGREGIANFSHYCATKAAVLNLTQSLAKEHAEYNININAVNPGVVRTALWNEDLLPAMAKEQGVTPDEAFDNFCSSIPLGRAQDPEDIGNMVTYLASDVARNMTGQGINVTSGQLMH